MRTEASLLRELASGNTTTPLPAARKAHLEAELEAVAPGALAEVNQERVEDVLDELVQGDEE